MPTLYSTNKLFKLIRSLVNYDGITKYDTWEKLEKYLKEYGIGINDTSDTGYYLIHCLIEAYIKDIKYLKMPNRDIKFHMIKEIIRHDGKVTNDFLGVLTESLSFYCEPELFEQYTNDLIDLFDHFIEYDKNINFIPTKRYDSVYVKEYLTHDYTLLMRTGVIEKPRLFKFLLNTGLVNVNYQDHFGNTVLHILCGGFIKRSHYRIDQDLRVELIKELLLKEIDTTLKNSNNKTALELAEETFGRKKVIKLLSKVHL